MLVAHGHGVTADRASGPRLPDFKSTTGKVNADAQDKTQGAATSLWKNICAVLYT
jgi:hypothetical protein